MDTSTLLYILLFVPFGLFLVIFAAVYMTNGYKRDMGRSLVSLGATVAAIVAALLLSKLLGRLLAMPLASAVTDLIPSELAMYGSLITDVIQSVAQVVLAFVLFGLLFIIALAVLKAVGKRHVDGKLPETLNRNTTGTKLAGLGIRFVDSLLVVLMLLLPLYGTLAFVMPPVSAVMSLSTSQLMQNETALSDGSADPSDTLTIGAGDTDNLYDDTDTTPPEDETAALVDMVSNHPILTLYKYGPADWVYSGLSSTSFGGATVDISRIADIMKGLLDRVMAFVELQEDPAAEEQAILDALQEIVSYTRKNVVEEKWFYNIVTALMEKTDVLIEELAATDPDNAEEAMPTVNALRDILDMSYADFKSNGVAVLDFAAYLLEDNHVNLISTEAKGDSTEETLRFADELSTRVGALLNHSEQMAAVKRLVVQEELEYLFREKYRLAYEDEYGYDYELYRDELDAKAATDAAAFMEKHWDDGLVTDPALQKKDGFSLIRIVDGNVFAKLEGVAISPLLGGEAAAELLDVELVVSRLDHADWAYEWYEYEETRAKIAAVFKKNPSLLGQIKAKLKTYEDVRVDKTFFETLTDGQYEFFSTYAERVVVEKMGLSEKVGRFYKTIAAKEALREAVEKGGDEKAALKELKKWMGKEEADQYYEEVLSWYGRTS